MAKIFKLALYFTGSVNLSIFRWGFCIVEMLLETGFMSLLPLMVLTCKLCTGS